MRGNLMEADYTKELYVGIAELGEDSSVDICAELEIHVYGCMYRCIFQFLITSCHRIINEYLG